MRSQALALEQQVQNSSSSGANPTTLEFIKVGKHFFLKTRYAIPCVVNFHNVATRDRRIGSRDRCYDFKNIFPENFSQNIGMFFSNYC
jgi:hypothetical protein